jgi:hypothetical protein
MRSQRQAALILYTAVAVSAAAQAAPDLPPEIRVYDTHKWEFDARIGYRYAAKLRLNETRIRDGKVFACRTALATDENGFPGRDETPDADFRVVLFGGSWTAFQVDGRTIADVLADRLSAATGKRVVVSNRSREGGGIVGMTVQSAPTLWFEDFDLAVFAFTTDDLDRSMHWQYSRVIGGEDRALAADSLIADPDIDGPNRTDAYLVDRRATAAWCAATKGKRDTVVAQTEARYRKLIRPGSAPRLATDDLKDDPVFRVTMDNFKFLGTPVALLNLPTPNEIAGQDPLSLPPRQQALWNSFEVAWGQRALRTLPILRAAGVAVEKIPFSDTDPHPSRYGMERYAEAMAKVLL